MFCVFSHHGRCLGLCGQRLHAGPIVTSDLFYEPDPGRPDAWRAAGALAAEMEAAAILAVAGRRGLRAACCLLVSDASAGGGERIGPEALEAASLRLGRVAWDALAAAG